VDFLIKHFKVEEKKTISKKGKVSPSITFPFHGEIETMKRRSESSWTKIQLKW